MTGVSFVVPVRNGAAHLRETLGSIAAQRDGRPTEIIVVEDHSTDESAALLRELSVIMPIEVVPGPGRGAAAAVNAGIRRASFSVICQVDQDVVLESGWMSAVTAALDDPRVAAAQGWYVTDPNDSFFPRLMGLDLEQRYASATRTVDHVCTGNAAYRADALHAVGLLDERLGYGYDNDLSYRLRAAGYHLSVCRAARSRHRWRQGLVGYLTQQYGFGYGRLDLVAKHPTRWAGDVVSPGSMMAHPIVMAVALGLLALALLTSPLGWSTRTLVLAAGTLLGGLVAERAVAGVRAWKHLGDRTALAFPLVHLARDAAWVAALFVWTARRLLMRSSTPAHSMRARRATL